MNKLNELIQELCPDGVEYKTIGELCSLVTKQTGFDYTHTIKDSLVREKRDDTVPYIQTKFFSGKLFNYDTDYYVPNEVVNKYPKITLDSKSVLFSIVGASIGNIGLFSGTVKCFLGGAICVAKPFDDEIAEWIYYYMSSQYGQKMIQQKIKGAGQATVTVDDIRCFRIPVPPLEVQREIVRILDNFTEQVEQLKSELNAELDARKKQYEYYRDELLSFDSDMKMKKLGDVCVLKAGKSISSFEISDTQTVTHSVPCYGGNGLRGYVKEANQQGNKSIIGRQGALCGNVCYATGSYYATEHAVVVTDKGYFDDRFLYHMLINKNLNQYKTAGAQPGLSVAKLETILVPVPNIEVQKRIGSVLDNFDAICSELNIVLSTEIEARQKQYEYYRDKLLTFEEIKIHANH